MNALLATLENISGKQKVLYSYSIPIIKYILPVLLSKFNSESNDIKFLSLKIFSDLSMQYLNDDTIFNLVKLGSKEPTKDRTAFTTQMLNDIIINNLLPQWSYMLDESEPVPLFALKLLSSLTDRCPMYVEVVDKLGFFPTILQFYQVGNKKLNQYTIKIIKNFVETPEVPYSTVSGYKILENTLEIIENMITQKQDWCIDSLCNTLQALVNRLY